LLQDPERWKKTKDFPAVELKWKLLVRLRKLKDIHACTGTFSGG